jgi:hypothetical protein
MFRETKTKAINISASLVLVTTSIGSALPALFAQTAHAAPSPEVVYNALPSVSPQTNYPSQAFEATSTSEFGDYIHLGGTSRILNTVTVTMSDWAKYSD